MIASAKYIVKMDEQRRIEIERSVVESTLDVKLSIGETLRFWALIGLKRQLQLLAPSNEVARARDRLDDGSSNEYPTWDSATDQRTELLRTMSGLVGISCASEPKRSKFRLTVEADAERLGLIQVRSEMVVFVAGEIL